MSVVDLLGIKGDTCQTQLTARPMDFKITSIKPFIIEKDQPSTENRPSIPKPLSSSEAI